MTGAASGAHEKLSFSTVNITEGGYLYVFVSNESNTDFEVYFDDLRITHTKGAILQEDHYYPFGLSIAALSSTAPLSKPNNFKYNGFEEQTEFDLGWYDYMARFYDPQLGRFMQVDPVADLMRRHSPYNYAFDNPIRFIDPDGMSPEDKVEEDDTPRGANFNKGTKRHTDLTITDNLNTNGSMTQTVREVHTIKTGEYQYDDNGNKEWVETETKTVNTAVIDEFGETSVSTATSTISNVYEVKGVYKAGLFKGEIIDAVGELKTTNIGNSSSGGIDTDFSGHFKELTGLASKMARLNNGATLNQGYAQVANSQSISLMQEGSTASPYGNASIYTGAGAIALVGASRSSAHKLYYHQINRGIPTNKINNSLRQLPDRVLGSRMNSIINITPSGRRLNGFDK